MEKIQFSPGLTQSLPVNPVRPGREQRQRSFRCAVRTPAFQFFPRGFVVTDVSSYHHFVSFDKIERVLFFILSAMKGSNFPFSHKMLLNMLLRSTGRAAGFLGFIVNAFLSHWSMHTPQPRHASLFTYVCLFPLLMRLAEPKAFTLHAAMHLPQ